MSSVILWCQESGNREWSAYKEDYKIKISMGVQMWNTYTIGQKLYDPESSSYITTDDRFNTQLRRTRMNFSGQPYQNLKFKITASLDLIGRDLLSATQGGANNGGSPIFRIWNAYIDWKIKNSSDLFHIVAGYIPPQIGRESITSALKSTSFEKSWSQNYLRRAIVGIGPGRAMGLNFGGQYLASQEIGFSYDLGLFSPEAFAFDGNSSGLSYSPLLTGRFALYFGEPESKTYTIGHKVNYFGKRQGLTMALAVAHQGKNDLFEANGAMGFDWLLNYKNLNFDGEWTFLNRSGSELNRQFNVKSNTGYIRLGYNILLSGNSYLEPVVMFVQYNGPLDIAAQNDALLVGSFAGTDEILDVGLNYHINPQLKISLFYTMNNGEKGEASDGTTFNNYYNQGGIGGIKRGDIIGLGIVGIF